MRSKGFSIDDGDLSYSIACTLRATLQTTFWATVLVANVVTMRPASCGSNVVSSCFEEVKEVFRRSSEKMWLREMVEDSCEFNCEQCHDRNTVGQFFVLRNMKPVPCFRCFSLQERKPIGNFFFPPPFFTREEKRNSETTSSPRCGDFFATSFRAFC